MNVSATNCFRRGALLLTFLSSWNLALAQSTWVGGAGGTQTWTNASNWSPSSSFPNGVDSEARITADLTSALNLTWTGDITLGSLFFGDPTSAFQRTTLGSSGSNLIFDVSSGNAKVEWSNTTNGTRDIIAANLILNDTLEIGISGSSGIELNGTISGNGGIIRRNNTGVSHTSGVGTLKINGQSNSYTGETVVQFGTLEFSGSVLKNQNSALGNTDTTVIIGNADTPIANTYSNAAVLVMRALDDTSHYEFARDLDFSKGSEQASSNQWRAGFTFAANGSGAPNTNQLTISGDLILGGKAIAIAAERRDMEIYLTGDIRTSTPATGSNTGAATVYWNPLGAGVSAADGVNAGIIRFSNRARTYRNSQNLTNGIMIIEGSVGASGTVSPIGTQTVGLSDGNGGNIVSANGQYSVRSLFLADAGATFERNLNMGGGSGTTFTSGTGLSYYGEGGNNIINGYQFGGLNTSGTVTFSGNFGANSVNQGSNKPLTLAFNVAFIAQEGGTVDIGGTIANATGGLNTRVTINQFRNHSELDTNADGIADTLANQTVGTATKGTIRLLASNSYLGGTEVLGGTLLANNDTGSATGLGQILVNTGAKFGGHGRVTPGSNGLKLNSSAILSPGDPTLNSGIGTLSVTGKVELNSLGGSILDFQISPENGINLNSAANLLDGSLNWSTITSGLMIADKNDFLNIDGEWVVNNSGTTEVNISSIGTGSFEAGMAWNLLDFTSTTSMDSGKYIFNFNGLDSVLASQGLAFDTTHFAQYGIIAVGTIPEPSRALLLLLSGLTISLRRKRS